MKGCQPCKIFNPEWEKVKKEFPNHNFKKIERESKITQQFINDLNRKKTTTAGAGAFEGFPSILLVKNEKNWKDATMNNIKLYQGPMKSKNIIQFLKTSNKD